MTFGEDRCLRLGDAVLGWLLWLPRDAATGVAGGSFGRVDVLSDAS